MRLLALLIIYLSASAGQEQKAIIPTPQQFDITTNIIEPISTSQAFNQYGFTPQAPTASYPITTLPLAQIITPIQKQAFNQHPTNHAYPKTIAPNIPVHASYRIADHPLVSSSAHAYPVQHSVEINHGDYEPYQNIFVQQHLETPAPRRIPPITRNLHPQFANPNTPQQPLRQYIPQQARPHFQRQFNPQQPFQPYINGANRINQPLKPYIAPSINQNVNVRGPIVQKPYIQNAIPQVIRKQYIQASSTPTNLPYNFKPLPVANTYQPLVKDSAQIRPSTLDNPSPLIPKPLPSPLKNLPASPRPVPFPVSGKPELREEDSEQNKKSNRDQDDKKPVREEEDESEESDESEEDDDEDEEEGSYERDYRPRYSHNYHENTEFDKKRYRPTFDAAKYIFNEDGDDEEGGKSEEEGGSEEKRPPPPQDRYKERSVPKPKQGPYREKPNEPERRVERPHSKRLASDESKEQESKSSRWVPLRQDVQKRRHREYYK